jgi:hypothetical protein
MQTQLEEVRLKNLIRDSKAPELVEGESWAIVLKELTRLKVAAEVNEERIVLYLYQLEIEDSIWRNESDSTKWSFATFLRKRDIYDPTRYGDCKVALARTPLNVLKKIGLSAAVLVTKKLQTKFHTKGFDKVVEYMTTNKKSFLLRLEVIRLIAEVGEANPGSMTKRVRMDSRTTAKEELVQANETIKKLKKRIASLKSKLEISGDKNRKLQILVDGFRSARRGGSRKNDSKAA